MLIKQIILLENILKIIKIKQRKKIKVQFISWLVGHTPKYTLDRQEEPLKKIGSRIGWTC